MAQHDYVIANGTGAAVRSDLNNGLSAIVTQNSGATEPATTYAFMRWADTTAGVMKMRNSANNAWITLYQLDGEWTNIAFENGTAAAPSIYFKDSGTDTGFYSPGANQVGISTGGTARLTIDSNGNVDIDSNTLYVDATNNRVGLGNSSPSSYNASASDLVVGNHTGAHGVTICSQNNSSGYIMFADGTTGAQTYAGQITYDHTNNRLTLGTNDGTTGLTVDSSQRVGIGTTSPSRQLDVRSTAFFDSNGDGTGSSPSIAIGSTSVGLSYVGGGHLSFTTGSAEKARIDSSGRLLVGTSSSSANASIVCQGTSGGSAGAAQLWLQRGQAASGIGAGDTLGRINFADNAGNLFAWIDGQTDGAAGTNDYPSRLVFSTTGDGASSPTERMRLTNAGYFRVSRTGTYNGGGAYHEFNTDVNDWVSHFINTNATPLGIIISYWSAAPNGTGSIFLRCADNAAVRFDVRSNGGIANYSANNVNLSDRNSKKDIAPAAGTWDCLKEWEIVNFRYKDQPDDADLNMGVIAQQVAESCPEVITVFQEAKEAKEAVLDEEGNVLEPAQEAQPEKLGVKDQQMMWMAIKALQEAQLRIEALEAEVAAIKDA
jgi:uncharacterized protein (DUF1684 family)